MTKTATLSLAILAAVGASGTALAEGDAAAGEEFFNVICITCHTGEPGALGPNLHGVIGRHAGTDPDFATYTEGLKAYDVVWTPETLDVFLKAPMTEVPGTQMIFPVGDNDRPNVIAYLETLTAE